MPSKRTEGKGILIRTNSSKLNRQNFADSLTLKIQVNMSLLENLEVAVPVI
jgi:hypothetical protein